MPRLSLVHSFLDRFEQRLEADCEQLKRQLLAQVDEQFGVLRTKVTQLRTRFGGDRSAGTVNIDPLTDDPPVETVPLDLCIESSDKARDAPSTSTGNRKRKSSSTPRSSNNNNNDKRQKTDTTDGSKKHQCKSPGCGKWFGSAQDLIRHERIHLGTKPFSCTWPNCRHSSGRKSHVVLHVRTKHFKLPILQKEQARLNIVDNRNPEDYVRVDNQLLGRRLE